MIQACVIFVFVISSALWPCDFETQDIDDRDVEEKALRTWDFEDMRLWGHKIWGQDFKIFDRKEEYRERNWGKILNLKKFTTI